MIKLYWLYVILFKAIQWIKRGLDKGNNQLYFNNYACCPLIITPVGANIIAISWLCQSYFVTRNYSLSDDSLKAILFPTMCGACYKNINNCQIVEKEVSLVHLASYLTDSLTFNEKKDRVDIRWQLKNRFPVSSYPCLNGMILSNKIKLSVLVIRSWTCYWFLSLVCWQWKLTYIPTVQNFTSNSLYSDYPYQIH